VIVQVAERLPRGALKAREVRIPAAWVDAIVVDPGQRASYDIPFDPALSGELTGEARRRSEQADHQAERAAAVSLGERQALARRAADELFNTGRPRPVVNFGVGVPDAVAKLIAARGQQHRLYQTIEHGTYGGTLLDGVLFGYARNASAMLDAATQFDFYAGGGLDIAFLGLGELDAEGNVNVSRLGGLTVGPGASSTSRRTRARWCSAAPSRPRACNCRPATARCACAARARCASWCSASTRSPSAGRKAWCAVSRCCT
jgi:acyl CoA:acetate/3-ketoacid CoA transferase